MLDTHRRLRETEVELVHKVLDHVQSRDAGAQKEGWDKDPNPLTSQGVPSELRVRTRNNQRTQPWDAKQLLEQHQRKSLASPEHPDRKRKQPEPAGGCRRKWAAEVRARPEVLDRKCSSRLPAGGPRGHPVPDRKSKPDRKSWTGSAQRDFRPGDLEGSRCQTGTGSAHRK